MPNDFSSLLNAIPGNLSNLVGEGRQAFLQSLSQHARLLTLETSLPASALLVEKFTGTEAMSDLFSFEIDSVSTSASFELKQLINQEISLRILLANGSTRSWHGIVTRAMQLGSDGALTRYRLMMQPWTVRMAQRRDSYVYQDMTVLEIIDHILKDYPNAKYRIDVKTVLPKRSYTAQYRETDFDFMARLCAEEGISFYFEHADDHSAPAAIPSRTVSDAPEAKTGHAKHCLVFFDTNDVLKDGSQPEIRYHRAAATEESDTITHFSQKRQIQSNAVSIASWDYKKLVATSSIDNVQDRPANVPELEVYESSGAYRYTDDNEAARIARARVESLALVQQAINGESAVRQLQVATRFTLTNYNDDLLGMASSAASNDPHQYLVLSIEHAGANNLFPGMQALAQHSKGTDGGTYRNRFTCVPQAVPIRPAYRAKPTAPGAQIAIVVGLENEQITTDRDHRIKVQFPWQRGDRAVSGQGTHPSTSNASGNETAGTWVRVMEPSAGANWGSNFTPRIGQEVQIDFIDGDIDRPVVVGQVYNGDDTPPFHGGDNHPGVLTGFQTREYAGSGYNQWVIDDTPGQLRQTFATTTQATQFNIGYLIKQDGNQRGSYRGNGLELTTDAWIVLRARQGLFITSTPRSNATSTQLDTTEAQGKLKAAQDLSKALSDAATQHQASPLSTPNGLDQLNKTISDKQQADGQDAPAFSQPITFIDSAAGINVTTAASSVTYAGQDVTQTSHGAHRTTAGEAISINAGKAASLFTHEGGAKVIAANNPVSFQAHTGAMDIISDQAMTITSSNGHIQIMAKDQILLSEGGGAFIDLNGANITIGAPSTVSVKGASHDFMGAASVSAALPTLPDSKTQLVPSELEVTHLYHDNEGLQGAKYEIKLADGSKRAGATDASGNVKISGIPFGSAQIRFKPDPRKYDVKNAQDNPDHKSSLGDSDIDTLLQKYRGQA
jgi:type VI secretion system secreted protein VgrG